MEWLEKGGVKHDVKIEASGVERGLTAVKDIKYGETVVFVPRSMIITYEMAL